MQDEDGRPRAGGRKPKMDGASALATQLGEKLRRHFEDIEAQPVPERLRELLEALEAKEKERKTE